MNENHRSDRTARLVDRAATASDSPAVTQADDTDSLGAASGSEKSDRTLAADASALQATLAGDSIGPRPDATLASDSVGLEPGQTLADGSVADDPGSRPSSSGVEEITIGGKVPIAPASPGAATLAEGLRAAKSQRPKPIVPDYEILDELGRGGMGVVYLARQVRLNRLCALKMILAGDHASKEAAHRFQTEAETIAKLRHANIAQIYHIGDCDGRVFFEMEFIEGGSLEANLNGTL